MTDGGAHQGWLYHSPQYVKHRCGRLYCDAHTNYQMRLSADARHDPVNGFWSRVCIVCYAGREGYNNHQGIGDLRIDVQGLVVNKLLQVCHEIEPKPSWLCEKLGSQKYTWRVISCRRGWKRLDSTDVKLLQKVSHVLQ